MIKIRRSIYKELISLNPLDREICGFVAGKNKVLEKIYYENNKSEDEEKYKMSFLKKAIDIFDMLVEGHNFIVVFHTHKFNSNLSVDDLVSMMKEYCYLIICRNKMYFYKLVLDENNRNAFKIVEEEFKVIED